MPYIIGSQHPIIHCTHFCVGLFIILYFGDEYELNIKEKDNNADGVHTALKYCIVSNAICFIIGIIIQLNDYKLIKK